jgi:serine/threonine-protein kinase RsbW
MNNSIRIRCSLNNLKVFREFVTQFLNAYALTEVVVNQIILAVDEITANLIIHANNEDENKFVKLTILQVGDCFLFELSDKGKPFDPEKYKIPDMNDKIARKEPGGWGLVLVKRIMDKVEFSTQNSHNICRLYKSVSKKSEKVSA